MSQVIRCATYVRKSSEEGLNQDFNSLHAQREACSAYIKSQRHEGWVESPTHYEDGGYSGGNVDRPGIQKLLADVASGKVQVVVVYKVDRLTRSLADFARIVESLDKHHASFVSVTQQFNTTTSMGRLTLNVLPSFAQFEREVTGERIRDKIASSKRKGMWMGGTTPLGYAVKGRTLAIIPSEAKLVRQIFDRYIELRSVTTVVHALNREGARTARRTTLAGRTFGGGPHWAGPIRYILKNPVYLGQIRHKKAIYTGQHKAIIDQETWDRAQAIMAENARRGRGSTGADSEAPLKGKLFDSAGNPMTPRHSRKFDGRRYRTYVSTAVIRKLKLDDIEVTHIPAGIIETLVADALKDTRGQPELQDVVRVELRGDAVSIDVAATDRGSEDVDKTRNLTIPYYLRRKGQEAQMVPALGSSMSASSAANLTLLRLMIRAYQWRALLEVGQYQSLEELSQAEKLNATYVARLLPLAFLAPDLTDGILDGPRGDSVTVDRLRYKWLPVGWADQRRALART